MGDSTKKIYIIPRSGDFANRLLVLDHVESMSHLSNSIISSHPVESQNQNIADHRYRMGKVISLTGMISDQWDTSLVYEPTPVFQSLYLKEGKRLRIAVEANTGADSFTTKYVNTILDGFDDVSEKDVVENVPEDEYFYITQANRMLASELDMFAEAQKKGMSLDKEQSNSPKVNGVINSISQGKEVLTFIDEDSTLVTIRSLWQTYDNMVLKSFNNVLRNGPQRAAYWVNLVFEEEMIAEESKKFSIASPANSEELTTTEDKDKTNTTTAGPTDENVVSVNTIYTQVLNEQVSEMAAWIQVNPKSKDYILEQARNVYMASSAKISGSVAEIATSSSINRNMQVVANLRGKTKW